MTAKGFINEVLLSEYKRIVASGFYYISFALVGIGIEFLGACLDPYAFSDTRLSRARFINAINTLFPKAYHQHSKALYEALRCGLIHQMRPAGGFWLTHRKESRREKTRHLGAFEGGRILIAEDFYRDFSGACNKVIEMIDKRTLTHPKLLGQFLRIT